MGSGRFTLLSHLWLKFENGLVCAVMLTPNSDTPCGFNSGEEVSRSHSEMGHPPMKGKQEFP